MATIKDIAKYTGYSTATVSRVLNDFPNVDNNTREKILKCAKELNYKQNVLGKLLKTQKSKMIICIIPKITQGLLVESFSSMQTVFEQAGYQLLLYPTTDIIECKEELIPLLDGCLFAGIIFISALLDDAELSRLNSNYPLVQCCEYNESVKASTVSIDYTEALKDETEYLIANGHRRIGFLTLSKPLVSTRKKEMGYHYALENHHIPYDPELIKCSSESDESTIEAAISSLMNLEKRPTAIICESDTLAFHCIRALIKSGFRVPEDCSVAGFDDANIARVSVPAITTIGSPLSLIGARTAELLLRQIETREKTNEKIIIPHELIIRDTVSPIHN